MDGQNKYLTNTISIPIIGLSFEALQSEINVGDTEKATIESIFYRHCLSLEPTAKSNDLGRFNLICLRTESEALVEFIKTDIPVMWSLLPPTIALKFQEALQVTHPRLTTGFSGLPTGGTSILLEDPQSISSTSNADDNWTQPPDIQRPPRYVSVIYKDANIASPPITENTKATTRKSSSDKSQTTMQSESDISTLVSSIREEMNREFQAHTEIISALKDEIVQLRNSQNSSATSPPAPPQANTDIELLQAAEHQNIVESLRQEIKELRNAIPPSSPPLQDMANLITAIVENMVPLITAAVRQGLHEDSSDSLKRSRTGATPIHLRTSDLQPINLINSYPPPDSPPPKARLSPPNQTTFQHPIPPINQAAASEPAPRSEAMEE